MRDVGVPVVRMLYRAGLRGDHMYLVSLASVALCLGFWTRAKGYDQDERGNAERRALFVGLWAPTFWLIGQSLAEREGNASPVPGGRPRPGVVRWPVRYRRTAP